MHVLLREVDANTLEHVDTHGEHCVVASPSYEQLVWAETYRDARTQLRKQGAVFTDDAAFFRDSERWASQ